MKLLFLIDNLRSGGAQKQIITCASLLKERGYNVEFVCYGQGNFYLHILEKNNIPVCWKISNNYLIRVLKIRHLIRTGKYNAVVSFLETPNFINCIAAIGEKKWKVITSERSAKKSAFTSQRSRFFAWFQHYSDYIVCNSENAKQMWIKHYPKYANKLTTIYNTVSLPEITTDYIPKRDGKLHIVIIASYQHLKNPAGLVKAVCLLNDDEKEKIKIDWYGNNNVSGYKTEAYDEALNLITENNLNNTIRFNGETNDVVNIMNQADVIGLFSKYEGLPNTICEGMSIGKPIIMSRVSDYAILIDETNGFLCDWDNPETIKNAIVSASELSINELKRMGVNSKHKAEKLFSQKKITNQWQSILKY